MTLMSLVQFWRNGTGNQCAVKDPQVNQTAVGVENYWSRFLAQFLAQQIT